MSDEKDELGVLGQLLADEAAAKPEGDQKPAPDIEALQRQLEYEKQRNDSLQGRIDSQLKPLNQSVRELQSRLSAVQAAPVAAAAPVADVTVQDLLAELSPADREAVGEKQLAIMAKLIEKPTQAMVDRVRNELQASFAAQYDGRLRQLEGQLAGQTGRDLWERVDQLSPGVKDRNDSDDPRWVEFLNGTDPISGRMRKDLGNAAVDAGDVARLALLHDEFLKATGQTARAADPDDRSRELRPDGSRAEPAVSSGEKPNIRATEVEAFYKDLANGKYEGKPEVREKMETLIATAIQEGRVL